MYPSCRGCRACFGRNNGTRPDVPSLLHLAIRSCAPSDRPEFHALASLFSPSLTTQHFSFPRLFHPLQLQYLHEESSLFGRDSSEIYTFAVIKRRRRRNGGREISSIPSWKKMYFFLFPVLKFSIFSPPSNRLAFHRPLLLVNRSLLLGLRIVSARFGLAFLWQGTLSVIPRAGAP